MATKIIAEVCQNHNGSRENLAEMIKAAAENGADIVKMQSIWSADVTKRDQFEEGVVDEGGKQLVIKRPYQAEVDRLKNSTSRLRIISFLLIPATRTVSYR
jgi:sialic acid synthase SpsE